METQMERKGDREEERNSSCYSSNLSFIQVFSDYFMWVRGYLRY